MQETTHGISIQLQDLPAGALASKVINEIALDFKSIMDNDTGTLTVLPRDIAEIKSRLQKADIAVLHVESIHLSEGDAWLLSDEDEFDADLDIFTNNDIEMDFNDFNVVGSRF